MKDRERIFRELVSSIVGSRLKASELRELAELLQSDMSFSRDVARTIYEVSLRISPQDQLGFSDFAESVEPSSDGGLTDLAYSVVQRRRLSKDKLVSMFRDIAPDMRWSSLVRDMTVRDMISAFLSKSSTSQSQQFLSALGMSVGEDPYLGGISSRGRR